VARHGARAMTASAADARSDALEAYIARRGAQGFRVETRSGLQAVIVRRHPLYFLLRWFPYNRAEQRLVVSVDADGEIAALRAEPLRW
jgi:type II secretory pathway component PulM